MTSTDLERRWWPVPSRRLARALLGALLIACGPARATASSPAPPVANEDQAQDAVQMETEALQAWSEGRYEEALSHWRRLIAQTPQRRDYRIGLVRTLVSAGRVQQARTELALAYQVPAGHRSDRYNTLIAQAEVLRAERREDAAREAFAAAAEVTRRGTTRRGALEPGEAVPLPWRFRTGILVDHFDNARDLESQLVYELGYRHSADLGFYGLYERHSRFDRHDEVYVLGVALQMLDALGLRVEAGVSPDADFRPRREALVGLQWTASDWLHPLLAYQHLDYREGAVSTFSPGLRFPGTWLGDVELQYSSTRDFDGAHSRYGAIRFDGFVAQRWLGSLSLQRGDEALPPEIRADFQRLALGLTWIAAREWHLRLDYAYEDREDLHIRQTLALGIGLRF